MIKRIKQYFKNKRAAVALDRSIAHWARMIDYAANNPDMENSIENMMDGIGEAWGGTDCALCQEYLGCYKCPLNECDQQCGQVGTVYHNIFKYDLFEGNFRGWLPLATRMLNLLCSLRMDIYDAKKKR